jgi:hypothetical protein
MGVVVMVIEGLVRPSIRTVRVLQCGQLGAGGWGVECALARMDTDESLPKHSFASTTQLPS